MDIQLANDRPQSEGIENPVAVAPVEKSVPEGEWRGTLEDRDAEAGTATVPVRVSRVVFHVMASAEKGRFSSFVDFGVDILAHRTLT